MKKLYTIICSGVLSFLVFSTGNANPAGVPDTIPPIHKVTLKEAHIGNPEVDTKLLDSYGLLPQNIRQFYLKAREVFAEDRNADFDNPAIIAAARENDIALMGGPMLGQVKNNEVTVWLRPATSDPLTIKVDSQNRDRKMAYRKNDIQPGAELRMVLDGLSPDTRYNYTVYSGKQKVAKGNFTTAPVTENKESLRIAFGSCFHKIGLHNPNLITQILERKPVAMMLLGDIAVDDRENQINMHRSDYLLRDVSKAWSRLAGNTPLYTHWDDHDYLNNDLSGIPDRFTEADREALRAVWQQNWNNPENSRPGIYFNTRIGPVELIMLDTRSCRNTEHRGEYGSYLGAEQMTWLKETLKNSDAPFKIISSGTMWSDYITKGKDSWGTWDTLAREEIFSFIEKEDINGVLLISGDRHGARGFTIPRSSGAQFYEFEAGSLGGVPGPDAMAEDASHQLFGYHGSDIIAFGEFTFNTTGENPVVIFRLIDEKGKIREEHVIPYTRLMY